MKNNPTVDEHFNPQVYLRGFSPEYEEYKKAVKSRKKRKPKCTIYFYDFVKCEQSQDAVPIKTQCYKKNLYELTDENGKYVYRNLLENKLSDIEKKFPIYINRLESKAFNESNYKTHSFLSKDEKAFWLFFIVIQILRSPQTLEEVECLTKEMVKDGVTDRQARNFSWLVCLPFYKEINENTPEAGLLFQLLDPMLKMYFTVCVDRAGRFITSDKPPYIYCTEFPCKEYERIVFPITSQICLILLGGKEKGTCKEKNCLFPANDEVRKMVFIDIVRTAHEKIFSNHILDSEELNIISYFHNKTE